MEQYVKYLKSTLKILTYSLFVFTPFAVNSKTSEIFEFNKISFIYFVSGLSFSLFIPVFIAERRSYWEKLKKAWFFLLTLGIFLFALFLSFLFSIDKYVSFYGYYGRFNGGLLSYLAYAWLALLVYLTFGKKEIKGLLKVSYFVSLLVALEAILTKYNFDLLCFFFTKSFANTCWTVFFKPSERIFGFLGQPNWLATYVSVNLIIGYFYFAKERGRKKWFYFFSLVILFFALLFTRSFSGIVASIIALGLFFLFSFFTRKEYLRTSTILVGTFIAIFLFSGYGRFVYQRGVRALNWLKHFTLSKQEKIIEKKPEAKKTRPAKAKITDSFKIRLIVWKGALELWKKYPILGTGPETFGIAYYFTRPLEHNYTSEWDYLYNKAHNEFLHFLATTGIIGFLAYLSFILSATAYAVLKYLKTRDLEYLLFLLVFIVIHITNFAGFSTTLSNLYLFLIAAAAFAWDKKVKKTEASVSENQLFLATFASIVAIILSLVFVGKFYFADIAFARGKVYEKLDDYYKATSSYNLALKRLYNPVYADKLSFSTANLYYLYKLYIKDSTVNPESFKNLSLYFSDKAIEDSPYNITFYKTKAKIYFLFYQADSEKKYLDKAIKALEKASKIAPTEPRVYYLYTYLKFIRWKDDPAKLEKILKVDMKHLLDLKYDYPQAHILKAKILYVFSGKEEAVKYLKEKAKQLNNPGLENAIEKLGQI